MKKFENFIAAFHNLSDIYNYEEPYGNVELTGMWGCLKYALSSHGKQ